MGISFERAPVKAYDETGAATIHAHDAEVSESGPYTNKKEITITGYFHGKVKVDFDLKSGRSGFVVYGRLYLNDAAKGTEQSETGTSYVTKSETLSGIANGDKIQLYLSGFDFLSSDLDSDSIYIHDGITSTITTSFSTPNTSPGGLAYDGSNLISIDFTSNSVYIHSGITSTITTSFSTPSSGPHGLTYDGANLISGDATSDSIYIHSGITSTITTSFSSPSGNPRGLTYDGTNLISSDQDDASIFIHSGITSTITTSFSSPSSLPTGLSYDGANLISADSNLDSIYIHSGITSTITTSFSTPSTTPHGLTGGVLAYARNLRIMGRWDTLTGKVTTFQNTV